nr:MAG TPA: hypothetical protein [Bacteriophage sp.]
MITFLMYIEGLIIMSLICQIVHSVRTSRNPKKTLQFMAFQVTFIIVLTILYNIVFNYVLDRR